MRPIRLDRLLPAGAVALSTALLAIAVWPPALAQSRNADEGRRKAQMCAVCHGPLGISMRPDAPHLAGQPAIYVETQLRAYRSGSRHHEVMQVIARPLTDDDIADLAAWYASIKVEAEAPR